MAAGKRLRRDGTRGGLGAPRGDALSAVVPAYAGTHNHECALLRHDGAPAVPSNLTRWLWVPVALRLPGTTVEFDD